MNALQWLGLVFLSFPFAVLAFIVTVKAILWIRKDPIETLVVVLPILGLVLFVIGGKLK